ncbi:DUF2339 domain-containing protein [Parashewanella curva]|nr:DUF2339 domain-containing protein [Parashewanella curva]
MDKDIVQLRSELRDIKAEFSEKISRLEHKISTLSETDICANPDDAWQKPSPQPEQDNIAVSLPKNRETKKQTLSFDFLSFLRPLFAILFDWFHPVTNVIDSYKRKGQLPLLILTLVGIALVLSGFGYLMQWLIASLGTGGKSLLMGGAAIFVISLGFIIRKRTQFDEFANTIIALGLLIGFSTIYFAGSVYQLFSSSIVLGCYLFIPFVSHVLAYHLNTKVLTTVGLVGFTLMPMLSGGVFFDPTFFLLSLLALNISSLWLASRMLISWLPLVCLVFSVIAIEYAILNYQTMPSSLLINSFYWVFSGAWLITAVKHQQVTDKQVHLLLAIIAANITLLLQSDMFSDLELTLCLSLNAFLFGSIALFNKPKLNETIRLLVWLTSAVWLALAIIAWFDAQYWGIAWGIEGILFLVIGSRFTSISLLRAGQALTTLGITTCLIALAPYFPLPAIQSISGWLLIVIVAALLGVWLRLQINAKSWSDHFSVRFLLPALQILEAIWLVSIALAVMELFLGKWYGAFVIPLQFCLLWRSRHCAHSWLDGLAVLITFYPLAIIQLSILEVDSFRFTLLPDYGKAAVISLFAQLWLWSEFYRRYEPKHKFKPLSEHVRIVFYALLPVCWLSSAFRHLQNDIFTILWVSPLLALFLSHKIKNRWLDIEAKALLILSAITGVLLIEEQTIVYGSIGIIGLMSGYFIGYRYFAKRNQHATRSFILGCSLVSLSFVVSIFIGELTQSFWIGFNLFTLCWLLAFYGLNTFHQLKKHQNMICVFLCLILISTWGLLLLDHHYVSVLILILVTLIASYQKHFKDTLFGQLGKSHNKLVLNTLLSISYCCLAIGLPFSNSHFLIAPLFVAHGITLLFMIERSTINIRYSFACIFIGITKIALLDAKTELIWQKFVLFMGVGVVLLVSAFVYQKLQPVEVD